LIQKSTFKLFIVVTITDERFTPQDGHSTGISRASPNEVLVRGGDDDGVDQGLAAEYDRSSTSTSSRAGKAGDLGRQGLLNPLQGDCRRPDAEASERSIYDNTPEHCYANVEKDETGRLLNRDTLAFRTSDYETEKSVVSLVQSNGQDGTSHLMNTPALHVDRRSDVPVIIHRTNKVSDVVCTNSFNHSLLTDRNLSNATTNTAEQVPYHTGRSTFYQRMDSGDGMLSCALTKLVVWPNYLDVDLINVDTLRRVWFILRWVTN